MEIDKMKVIAHRGASGEFAENSLLAFEQALIQGCDAIEFDVQFHQPSSEFILLHDSYLKIIDINGSNHGEEKVHFNQVPLDELIHTSPNAKYNICTLVQALQCINIQCQINIELKSATQGAQLANEMQKLEAVIRHAQARKLITFQQLVISSFNHHALVYVANHFPEMTTAALIACCPINYAEFCQQLKVNMLNLSIECMNPEIIKDAHRRGLKVWVYTVDHPDQIKQCLDFQVDGIFTNFPLRTRQTISALT
ncbi:glycerophosphodiester phosphodiesterase [Cognaticolwellia beringensis]|uniref:Glycerophosphodiester phosphodiesterase n=2 Tax=Cognaticolwellia beringensis TaxID=1967665 RepID=A0A222G7Z5_9GAMM|nr:glycerophosphodiester phosphodiesterase [Cognaticolwellia beringensis]